LGGLAPDGARGFQGRRGKRLQRPGIIYCATTTAVDEVSGALGRAGIPVTRYHGKMRATDREAAQRQFMLPSRRLIMVATTAFGMGIDKPNIRYILHYQTPGSLEQYVQEIGRTGCDGGELRPARHNIDGEGKVLAVRRCYEHPRVHDVPHRSGDLGYFKRNHRLIFDDEDLASHLTADRATSPGQCAWLARRLATINLQGPLRETLVAVVME
jgi:hypothetical protein